MSRNHELGAPDFSVNSPRFTEWASTWSRSAANGSGRTGRSASGIARRRYRWPRPVRLAPCTTISQLRIFTEPQQGATYDDLLAVARRAEQLGFGAFFRSDHYLAMGERPRPAGCPGRPTRGSPWPGSPATPSRSASARSSRRRRSGCPVRWPSRSPRSTRCPAAGSSSGSAPAGTRRAPRLRHPVPAARRALRPAGGAARGDHRPVVDAGRRALRSFAGAHYPVARLAGAAQAGPGRRGADHRRRRRARGARRRWRPVSPPSSTRRSCRSTVRRAARAGRAAPARRSAATPTTLRLLGRARRLRRRRTRPRSQRRAAAIGREPDELRENGVAGTSTRRRATLRALARGRRRAHLSAGARPRRPRPPRRIAASSGNRCASRPVARTEAADHSTDRRRSATVPLIRS